MTALPEILFLCSRLPFPPNKGDKIRSHAILTHLVKTHRVHLACFAENDQELAHIAEARTVVNGECLVLPLPPLRRYGRMVGGMLHGDAITVAVYTGTELRNWVKSLCGRRPLAGAVVFGSAVAPCLLDANTIDPSTVLFDMVDVDSDKWLQLAERTGWPKSWIYRREARILLDLERKSAAAFGATLLISPFESASFQRLAPEWTDKIKPLVNGVDATYFSPGLHPNPYPDGRVVVAMTGHMDYQPNVDAALWFADEVLPRIRSAIPQICFYVVGSRPPAALRRRSGHDVVVTGYVDDMRPYLQHASAVVAPLRIARGLQNKVLEAMAMQKPVIATWEATRALAARSGIEVLVANEPDAFAAAVIDAISGTGGEQIGIAARRYVRERHDWGALMEEFDRELNSISRRSDKTADGAPTAQAATTAFQTTILQHQA
jgi:sugar transferase (PEP-CTERM/EpsH1 system associated)